MYWANPVSYAFQGLASNEFWGREYSCENSELMPPTGSAELAAPYPEGFGGYQACPVTSGTDYIVNHWGIFDREWLKWIMAVCVIGWWFIFTLVTYIGLRFVRHSPPQKPRMKNVEISDEEEIEMKQFNIKEVKAQHLHSHHSHHDSSDVKSKQDSSSADIEEAPVKESGEMQKMGGEFVEGGAYLSWHKLNYSVTVRSGLKKNDLQLLHEVSGFVKPGMMLALMGSSGAGKSTLMDVLALRKTGGKITGEVLVNGRKTDNNLSRIIGYVEQQDIHAPTQTIYEAIELSALVPSPFLSSFNQPLCPILKRACVMMQCRLPSRIPREEKKKYARSLLKVLGLEHIANRVIGVNAADGISADQRKRVTIGVEMAADPAILFLDEPTSGLDSFGAERVMTAVRKIAQRGTSVVCTIHQPSATIFGMFTHLLLLKKGGYTTYFGPIGESDGDYSVLLDYFSKYVPFASRAQLLCFYATPCFVAMQLANREFLLPVWGIK
jgi:ABC-type multidrug transport system ATPase subunit